MVAGPRLKTNVVVPVGQCSKPLKITDTIAITCNENDRVDDVREPLAQVAGEH